MEIEVFKSQYQFLAADDPVLCWIAGVGAGKSWSLAWWVLDQCMKYPGNIGMVAAATNPQLRMATIPTFHEVFDLAGIEYKFSEWRGVCEFPGTGSWFKYQSLDIPEDQLKGSTLGFLAVDEVDACPEQHIKKLLARLRRAQASRHARLTGNSPPPQHYLETWFLPQKAKAAGKKVMGRLMQSSTYENTLLPPDYIEKLETQYPPGTVDYRRYVMGEMGVPREGVVYEELDQRHLIEYKDVPWKRICGHIHGLDLGYGNATAFLKGVLSDDDVLYVVGEHYQARTLLKDHAAAIKALYEQGAIAADHDAQDRAELLEMDIVTIPAIKSVNVGIDAVKSRLRSDRIFFVADRCPRLMEETPNYVWSDSKDEPIKRADHAMDALRYMVAALDVEDEEVTVGQGLTRKDPTDYQE